MTKFVFPSIFTFRRSLDVTQAFMYQSENPLDPNGKVKPLKVELDGFVGTLSSFEERGKIEKKQEKGENTVMNPQVGDTAFLEQGFDYLTAKFSILPKNFANEPMVSNSVDALEKVTRFMEAYRASGGMDLLAKAYLTNILSGRWFFRNDGGDKRVQIDAVAGAETFTVVATSKRWDYSLEGLTIESGDFDQMVNLLSKSLSSSDLHIRFNVTGSVHLCEGVEVYPSQAYPTKKPEKVNGQDYGRLYKTITDDRGNRQGILTSQKVNNAIRTIDKWHGGDKTLPVDPFGPDRQYQVNRRVKDNSFFSLIENNIITWTEQLEQGKSFDQIDDAGDIHFSVACLIRGGVYNGKGKKSTS